MSHRNLTHWVRCILINPLRSNPVQWLCREEGEFHLLIKELWDYPECFKVYIYIYIPSLCILHFVCHTVLCAARPSGSTCQWSFWILAFTCTVALNWQNTSQNACYRCEKHRKLNPIQIFLCQFRRQCVNVIDTMWGRIYFLMCEMDENFRLGVPSVTFSVQWPLLSSVEHKKKRFFL